jgi:DNA polymerase-3 subunit epsilon
MKRIVVLDTETTGLKVENGNRILEIGAVEIIDGVVTGKNFQAYINPERDSEPGALNVHGITTEFLKDKPKFVEIVDDFIKFIAGAKIVIHNADFDIKFLNSEFDRANRGRFLDHATNIIDTLKLDKMLYAEERKHSLDAICVRFNIDTTHRTLHGALLDSEILAEVFLEMNRRHDSNEIEADMEQKDWVRPEIKRYNITLPSAQLSEQEETSHQEFLTNLSKTDKVQPVFMKSAALKM